MRHFAPLSPSSTSASPTVAAAHRHPRWTALAALLLAGPFAGTAQAATITVSDDCSLVNAITAANSDTATGGCAAGSGADTIVIPPNRTTTLTQENNSNGIDGKNGLPLITSTLRIEANGNVIERSAPNDGTLDFRLFRVTRGGALTLNRAVLRGGREAVGGAISVDINSSLTLTASDVTNNVANGNGGGIANSGTLTIRNSSISGNRARNSSGGGLFHSTGTVTLSNVTIANNTSGSIGGGLHISAGTVNLDHVTVTGNHAPSSSGGGGMTLVTGVITLRNSVVSGNTTNGTIGREISHGIAATFVVNGNNLIGQSGRTTAQSISSTVTLGSTDRTATSDGTVPTALGNILEVDANNVPVVKDNGGATPTVALVAGSPAIDAANPTTALPRDQRRYLPNGPRDIGAFEYAGTPPVLPAAPTALSATAGDGSLTIAFTPGEAGSSPITNYAFALGDSATFTALDPADGESPVTISGLSNGTSAAVRLKAISEDGESAASESVTGTPANFVNGSCGSASGTATATVPVEGLCEAGTASVPEGFDNAWYWSCKGSGTGTTATCAAPYATPTITLKASPTHITVGGDGSTVTGTSTSGLKPELTSTTTDVCSVMPFAGGPIGTTVIATGVAAGTCTVKATLAGTGDVGTFRYLAAADETVDITVAKGAQTITGFAAGKTTLKVGEMTTLSATGGESGNEVSFKSLSSEICFVSGAMVTALSAGTCTVAADQAGNDGYNAATQKTLDITVAKAAQLISGFKANPASLKVGGMATLSASGGASGNSISFRSSTGEICSVSGAMVTALSTGTCTVIASQAGNADFEAADEVSLNVPVNKAAQLISGLSVSPSTLKVGESGELLAFGGASGKPVRFSVAPGSASVCAVEGSEVFALAVGTCTVIANQAGNASFEDAEPATLNIGIEAADVVAAPALKLDMNDLDFGTGYLLRFRDIGVETTSEAEVVTLSNSGTAPLAISSIVTTGDFRHTTTCGQTVAPGATCTISIRFSPKAVGTRTGETRITSNAVTSPDVIRLSGTGRGLQPAIKTNVSSFNFGRVRVGAVSRDQTLVITSTGSGPLEIRNITVTGDYTGSHNCPRFLDAGKSCQVTGRFRPKATGVRPGAVSILTSAGSTPTQVTLTGTGTSGGTVN